MQPRAARKPEIKEPQSSSEPICATTAAAPLRECVKIVLYSQMHPLCRPIVTSGEVGEIPLHHLLLGPEVSAQAQDHTWAHLLLCAPGT